ncbi:hypothetical protein [Natronococcus occultus]|uniref:DUF8009 domain-containing protein n=1 Tax=Natronococcus occultus SP4 TaxID=694430 RepID=L0K3I1_9EURY|nr:hypothetical protein [Natronococcus occultus]AGB38668.1 hypothetical protein Natoc_2912 [Natronococcus occultus SP4]
MRDPSADEPSVDHPAAEIQVVVVDPDDVVEAFERNYAEENFRRTHVLRLVPPFEEEQRAEPYVEDGPKRYPPDRDPEPIHLDPATFVRNEAGVHPNETHLTVPTREQARSAAHDDHGEDASEALVDEYHEEALEEWERRVRNSLVDAVRIHFDHGTADEIWTEARYEAAEE